MKISIITITYNSEKTLEDTIKSIAAQKYKELEYLIIDGGSTDQTLEIVKRNTAVVTHWISEPDRGISDAFNKGIRMATGDVIGIINSDDLLAENALRNIAKNMSYDTEVFYGNAIYFSENQQKFRVKPHDNIDDLRKCMALVHPATFVRKSAYEKYGDFDLSYTCIMDRELLLRMYLGGAKFQFFDADLAWMRLDGVSMKNYLSTTIPEGISVSIKYGMSPVKARLYGFKNATRFRAARFIRKLPFAKTVRKYFHAKTTELNI